ncbi:MAG: AI-2E family transporter [Candidatus Paceibacterota bacterium]
MQTKTIERLFFFGILLATLVFTFMIFRPFWIVLILGMSFAIVLHPLYLWFTNKKLPEWFSALATVLLFILVLCGPLLGIGAIVFNQSQNVYRVVVSEGSVQPFLESIETRVNNYLPDVAKLDINQRTSDFISYVSENIASIFSSTVSAFFSFLLMLLIIFYFLKDGAKWKKAIVLLSPLGDKDDEKIISRLAFAVNAVIKGYLFVALIQGVLMWAGLWIFNIPNPALWGVVAAVSSLLPTIGTALVSVPAIIFLFATGNTAYAVGLFIWAVAIVGLVDNFLSPLIVGKKINLPSLMILFSVLGGISLLGPVGILIGPLTVSLLYTLISIYRNEFFKQNAIL